MNPTQLIEKARESKFHLWLLNFGLNRMIPFNKPHGFKILEIGTHHIRTFLPYKKANLNHIKGLHACALATLSEFTSGVLLISLLDARKYRLILKSLEMEYHYQGKMDAEAHFTAEPAWLAENITEPLKTQDAVVVTCEVKTFDKEGNHISTGKVNWQVKEWSKVKTKTDTAFAKA
jgi:acyl-coenzyme A thioesterase PaaI-like protein